MANKIKSKAITPENQEFSLLGLLATRLAIQKFADILPAETLHNYIKDNFLRLSLSNVRHGASKQWALVYVDEVIAGYALITTTGKRLDLINDKKAIRISEFGILEEFHSPAVFNSLFKECMKICKGTGTIWINDYWRSPFINDFKKNGFVILASESACDNQPIPSVCLIKQHPENVL